MSAVCTNELKVQMLITTQLFPRYDFQNASFVLNYITAHVYLDCHDSVNAQEHLLISFQLLSKIYIAYL